MDPLKRRWVDDTENSTSNKRNCTGFFSYPAELICSIYSYFSVKDIPILSLVCKDSRNIIQEFSMLKCMMANSLPGVSSLKSGTSQSLIVDYCYLKYSKITKIREFLARFTILFRVQSHYYVNNSKRTESVYLEFKGITAKLVKAIDAKSISDYTYNFKEDTAKETDVITEFSRMKKIYNEELLDSPILHDRVSTLCDTWSQNTQINAVRFFQQIVKIKYEYELYFNLFVRLTDKKYLSLSFLRHLIATHETCILPSPSVLSES